MIIFINDFCELAIVKIFNKITQHKIDNKNRLIYSIKIII